jgi:hypothetical protein
MTDLGNEALNALDRDAEIISDMINMGERIAWGADTSVIDRQRAVITALRQQTAAAEAAALEREAALAGLGPIAELLPDAVAAAEKAMRKFPQPNYVISKWAEETGEVTKDLIHMAEGRQTADKLRGEMVQALAMLHRLLVEGDQVHGLPPVCDAIRALTPPDVQAAKIGGDA